MLMLLAQNPIHPDEMPKIVETSPKQKLSRYFSEMFPIVTEANTIFVPREVLRGKSKILADGKTKRFYFKTDIENVISDKRSTLPSRLIAKLHNVKRIWTLDYLNSKNELVYTSMVGDKLVLTNC